MNALSRALQPVFLLALTIICSSAATAAVDVSITPERIDIQRLRDGYYFIRASLTNVGDEAAELVVVEITNTTSSEVIYERTIEQIGARGTESVHTRWAWTPDCRDSVEFAFSIRVESDQDEIRTDNNRVLVTILDPKDPPLPAPDAVPLVGPCSLLRTGMFDDGGSISGELVTAHGDSVLFGWDGRMFDGLLPPDSPPPLRLAHLYAEHCQDLGAVSLPMGSAVETDLVRCLQECVDRAIDPALQDTAYRVYRDYSAGWQERREQLPIGAAGRDAIRAMQVIRALAAQRERIEQSPTNE